MNPYIGHSSQIGGVEEHRLVGGKGDGMRIYEVNNTKGLEMVICPDRNGDIARLRYRGINLSYFSPCGYVAPAYYESRGNSWLKSFTAGFLTTCGLQAVGTPCVDGGEELPLHGSIAILPCEHSYWEEDDSRILIHTLTKDEVIFGRKLVLSRTVEISKMSGEFAVHDEIHNTGDRREPIEILYHMNMGYPLLDEDSIVKIPAKEVIPRDDHAAQDLKNWMRMETPAAGYQERCYYHRFDRREGRASIFQPKLGIGLEIRFDSEKLDGFVEWKMMGIRDYVLGLECGNCYPDGRDVMRRTGMLKFLEPDEKIQYDVQVLLSEKQ